MTAIYESLRARLGQGRAVLLDGPMGSELVRRGIRWRKHGMLTDAPAVQALHQEYAAAGADVLRTNTFALNPRVYLNVFRNLEHMRQIGAPGLEELTPRLYRTSVRLAKQARAAAGKEASVAIAGVLSPAQHCYRPDLAPSEDDARREQEGLARVFAEEGVDLLVLESMNTIREARAALAAGRAVGLPVWVSFVLGPEGELLGRESLADAAREAEKDGAEAILVNCAPPESVGSAVEKLKKATARPVGGFAMVGKFSPPSWKFDFFPQFVETEAWTPARYAERVKRWRETGATIVGGCCGTGPAHTAAMRGLLGNGGRA